MTLILASGSGTRRKMLEDAGVSFEVRLPDFDEEAAKARDGDESAQDLARRLARGKAFGVIAPGLLILGADQTLETDDGIILGKPADLAAARTQLANLRGRTHQLHSAASLVRDGAVVWEGLETVTLSVRDCSDSFLDLYVETEGEALLWSAGAYRIESLGAQLFDRIEGSHFAILGLPLLTLLEALRTEGELTS